MYTPFIVSVQTTLDFSIPLYISGILCLRGGFQAALPKRGSSA